MRAARWCGRLQLEGGLLTAQLLGCPGLTLPAGCCCPAAPAAHSACCAPAPLRPGQAGVGELALAGGSAQGLFSSASSALLLPPARAPLALLTRPSPFRAFSRSSMCSASHSAAAPLAASASMAMGS